MNTKSTQLTFQGNHDYSNLFPTIQDVLVYPVFHNKAWLKQQKFISLLFWKLKV